MYFCSRQVCFKELKIKLILPNLRHGAQRSHSEACSLKKCTLPYIYFVFKCLVLYFGIKKEWLEKKFEYFFIGKRTSLKWYAQMKFLFNPVEFLPCDTKRKLLRCQCLCFHLCMLSIILLFMLQMNIKKAIIKKKKEKKKISSGKCYLP